MSVFTIEVNGKVPHTLTKCTA